MYVSKIFVQVVMPILNYEIEVNHKAARYMEKLNNRISPSIYIYSCSPIPVYNAVKINGESAIFEEPNCRQKIIFV